jgi:hypothetical protein
MTKLIAQYAAHPTQANRDKIVKHIAKHPMAMAMASKADIAALRAIGV